MANEIRTVVFAATVRAYQLKLVKEQGQNNHEPSDGLVIMPTSHNLTVLALHVRQFYADKDHYCLLLCLLVGLESKTDLAQTMKIYL